MLQLETLFLHLMSTNHVAEAMRSQKPAIKYSTNLNECFQLAFDEELKSDETNKTTREPFECFGGEDSDGAAASFVGAEAVVVEGGEQAHFARERVVPHQLPRQGTLVDLVAVKADGQ